LASAACCSQVLAQAITRGCDTPVDDYLKMTNRKKVVIRDIDPKSVSTQDFYGFVNLATREWKVCTYASNVVDVAFCSCQPVCLPQLSEIS
jgi:hypothetical protein